MGMLHAEARERTFPASPLLAAASQILAAAGFEPAPKGWYVIATNYVRGGGHRPRRSYEFLAVGFADGRGRSLSSGFSWKRAKKPDEWLAATESGWPRT